MRAYWRTVDLDFAAWLDDVAELLEKAREVRHALGTTRVTRGSPADLELRHAGDLSGRKDGALLRMHRLVQAWTVMAADLLAGLAALCRSRDVALAPIPMVRACVEYSARTVWLLDDNIRPDERLGRAWLDVLMSATGTSRTASRLAGEGSEPHRQAEAALAAVRDEILLIFPDAEIDSGRGSWRIAGQRFIGPTETAFNFGRRWGDAEQWQGTYGALSQMAHPSETLLEFFEDSTAEVLVSTDRDTVHKLVLMALVPYYQAIRHLLAYYQWPAEPFERWEAHFSRIFPDAIGADAAETSRR